MYLSLRDEVFEGAEEFEEGIDCLGDEDVQGDEEENEEQEKLYRCTSSAQMGQNGSWFKRHSGPLLVWVD